MVELTLLFLRSGLPSRHGVKSMENESAFHNKYSLVKGVARRARQLQSGAPALGISKSIKACRVAQDEIRSGAVTYVVNEKGAKVPTPPSLQTSDPNDHL